MSQVAFLLFGGLPGAVSLRGRLEEVEGNRDTVKVSTAYENFLPESSQSMFPAY